MNTAVAFVLAVMLASAAPVSGEELTDAPTTINVNTAYEYTPAISDSSHSLHILDKIVLKNLKTGDTPAVLTYSGPEWLKINVATEYEYSHGDPTVINEVLKTISFSGVPLQPGTYNPRLTLSTLNGTFLKEWQWTITVKVSGAETMPVTFYAQQGGDALSYTVTSPFALTFPAADVFSRDGYRLAGWGGGLYECGQIVQLDYRPEGYVFYAHWVADSEKPTDDDHHIVTFNYGSEIKKVTVHSGSAVSRPSEPVKTGMAIRGWYTTVGGGTEWNFNNVVNEDLTLYAVWAPHFSLEKKGTEVTLQVNPTYWSGYQHTVYWSASAAGEALGYSTTATHNYPDGLQTITLVSEKGGHRVSSIMEINVQTITIAEEPEGPAISLLIIGLALMLLIASGAFPYLGWGSLLLSLLAGAIYFVALSLAGVL